MRCVSCFDKQTGELVREIPLMGVTLEELQAIFAVPAYDEMVDAFNILPAHELQLRRFLPEKLDLGQYDYELNCYAVRGAPPQESS
jgi:hypothetical protein